MQRILNPAAGRWMVAVALLTLLASGCSTYRPLDSGSTVPWAKALRAGSQHGARATEARVVELPGLRHRVMPGDQLSKLALRYGVTVQELADANNIEPPYIIYAGDLLTIPATRADRQPAPSSWRRYVVERGDSLSVIADRLDLALADVAALNRLKPPYRLYAGQSLRLPEVVAATAPRETPPASSAPSVKVGKPPPLSDDGFLWPLNGKVIGGFGTNERGERRDGINIAARRGAPVLAAQDGVVVYAGDAIRGYGRMILIRHDEGYVTTYAHNSALLVQVGEVVRRGQVIARVGATGDVARAQLHFELRKGRTPIDPETVLVREATAVASTQ